MANADDAVDSTSVEKEEEEKNDVPTSTNADSNYAVGDFVYVEPSDPTLVKRIVHISRVFKVAKKNREAKSMQTMVQANNYFRPEETFHTSLRKFYAKEVFKTEKSLTFPMAEILGRCQVLSVADFIKYKVENLSEEDVFVCENRYMANNRFFKKIKIVPFAVSSSMIMTERETPLTLNKFDSIFKERLNRHKEELAEVDEETRIPRPPLPNVIRAGSTGDEMVYEQYNLGNNVVKLGDFVCVKVPPIVMPGGAQAPTLKAVRHISKIWINPQGVCMFTGSVYSTAIELYMSGVTLDKSLAYKQEVYLTSVLENLPLTDIIGKCSVLHVREYAQWRLTEVTEKDVFMCANYYDEVQRRISVLQAAGIVKFELSPEVQADEVYYFSSSVNLQKSVLETVQLSHLPRKNVSSSGGLDSDLLGDLNQVGEDSRDSSAAPSLSSSSTPPPVLYPSSPAPSKFVGTPASVAKPKRAKQTSGYLLFSGEIRKSVTLRNPSANFGEISRIVGMEWKKLLNHEKKVFEDRAHIMNLEAAENARYDTIQCLKISKLYSAPQLLCIT